MFEFVKHLFKLQFLLIIIAIFAGIYYPQILEQLKSTLLGELVTEEESIKVHFESGQLKDVELFTKQQLAQYNGENDGAIYLAILGNVYDVTKGKKHYGPGCAYNYFVGRDASASFVTGEFEKYDEQEADHVNGLKPNDLLSLANWKDFYDKDYIYKGKLIGRFYNAAGAPTTYHHQYLALLEQAKDLKTAALKMREKYPDCNIQWTQETGTRVWCTKNSGGKERSWTGYPRMLYEMGSTSFRCACISTQDLETTEVMIKPYENCDSNAHECYYRVD